MLVVGCPMVFVSMFRVVHLHFIRLCVEAVEALFKVGWHNIHCISQCAISNRKGFVHLHMAYVHPVAHAQEYHGSI